VFRAVKPEAHDSLVLDALERLGGAEAARS